MPQVNWSTLLKHLNCQARKVTGIEVSLYTSSVNNIVFLQQLDPVISDLNRFGRVYSAL